MPKAKKISVARGFILYRGPSALDGSPIVCVATLHTSNIKTGDMVQTWILPDSGLNPLEALQQGANFGACGNCALQGTPETKKVKRRGGIIATIIRMTNRVCYVNLGQAPNAVSAGLKRGIYPVYCAADHSHLLRGRAIRFGAYGDPAAMPDQLLIDLRKLASNWTGYTHQAFWASADRAEFLASFLMISCHNPAQHREALRRGWRPFTAIAHGECPPIGAVECPAYTRGVQCINCTLCKGGALKAKPVFIVAHAKVGANLAKVQATGL